MHPTTAAARTYALLGLFGARHVRFDGYPFWRLQHRLQRGRVGSTLQNIPVHWHPPAGDTAFARPKGGGGLCATKTVGETLRPCHLAP